MSKKARAASKRATKENLKKAKRARVSFPTLFTYVLMCIFYSKMKFEFGPPESMPRLFWPPTFSPHLFCGLNCCML